ncbi:hypothetical protein ACH9L7_07225 [Haloferax sp. S1W]|uniref:hypothetical protein n=1 Tax=Haloferax sp. S1W TaxID=3377110 RepID=UPI0037C92977
MSIPALQRTVRRGFALVIIQLGVMSGQLFSIQRTDETIATFVTLPLVLGAAFYLLVSVVRQSDVLTPPADEKTPHREESDS